MAVGYIIGGLIGYFMRGTETIQKVVYSFIVGIILTALTSGFILPFIAPFLGLTTTTITLQELVANSALEFTGGFIAGELAAWLKEFVAKLK